MKKLASVILDLLKERMVKGEVPATWLLLLVIVLVCRIPPEEVGTAAEITKGVAGCFSMIILVIVSLPVLFFVVAGSDMIVGVFPLAVFAGLYYLILNADAFFGALIASVLVSAAAGAMAYAIGYIDESKTPQVAGKVIVFILSVAINFGILFGLPLLLA